MDKFLYVVDIRFKQKNLDLSTYILDKNAKILSLTPYSNYLLDEEKYEYMTFHDIIPMEEFRDNALSEYIKIEELINQYKSFSYLFYYLVLLRNKQLYYLILIEYFRNKKNIKIIYITDTEKVLKNDMNKYDFMSNKISLLHTLESLSEIIQISSEDKLFYFKKSLDISYSKLKNTKNILSRIINSILKKEDISLFFYDNKYLKSYFMSKKEVKVDVDFKTIQEQYQEFKNLFFTITKISSTSTLERIYDAFFLSMDSVLTSTQEVKTLQVLPFVFLSDNNNFLRTLVYKQNNLKTFFMQHGSYIHESMTLKHCEIYPADVNFVFNEYTKALFERRGAKRVEVVGSVDFNKPYRQVKQIYDYVYITFCSSYTYPGTFIGMDESIISMDGNNIYQRHKNIIKLFGLNYPDKKLCIKVQPSIMSSSMYVPFYELSKEYKNIIIEFTKPLHDLIEESKYIISDYFSSEFSSQDIHYQKDIIMFTSSPYRLKEEILEDMQKMFILCEDENSIDYVIDNIETITKNRKRYSNIIEYYSSKKCNTIELATKILKEEYGGR